MGAGCREAVARVNSAGGIAGLRTLDIQERPAAYGYTEDALVLVRPDGYVGLVTTADDSAGIRKYLDFLQSPRTHDSP
jgi:hypothetical protein